MDFKDIPLLCCFFSLWETGHHVASWGLPGGLCSVLLSGAQVPVSALLLEAPGSFTPNTLIFPTGLHVLPEMQKHPLEIGNTSPSCRWGSPQLTSGLSLKVVSETVA